MSSQGLSRGRYFRLMALSATEILGTIPLGTYFIVTNAKAGVQPWESWAEIHSNYSDVHQVPSIVWEGDPFLAGGLEIFRWSLVACAFIFFAFFGFADEACQHYRSVYTSIASRIRYSTSTLRGSTLRGSSYACVVRSPCWSVKAHLLFCSTSSAQHMKRKDGVAVVVVRTGGDNKRKSSVSFIDRSSTPSIAGDVKPEFKIKKYSPSNSVASSSVESFDDPERQRQSTPLPPGIMPAVPPASVSPHLPDETKSTVRAYAGLDAV
jgi:Pheromone A receptor